MHFLRFVRVHVCVCMCACVCVWLCLQSDVVRAQECNGFSTCLDCTVNDACVWCAGAELCEDKSAQSCSTECTVTDKGVCVCVHCVCVCVLYFYRANIKYANT